MNVLQLGTSNWANNYQIPDDLDWKFNQFPLQKPQMYDLVIITEVPKLSDKLWRKLQWLSTPYSVLYLPEVKEKLSKSGQLFLTCQAAIPITEDIQETINHLQVRYYFGQSGIRYSPQGLLLNSNVKYHEFIDSAHVKVRVSTDSQWLNIGTYRSNLFLDPQRKIKLWLEGQFRQFNVRLRVFIQPSGGDGDPAENYILNVDSLQEVVLPIEASSQRRYASISIEVKGKGEFILGNLHSRWGREGYGEFITGGHRLVNPAKREDVGYYFNPGDLKPPLNVYFSGARTLEGFEAYPLFRGTHTPTLLFTDMRLEAGQFYTTDKIEQQIEDVILKTLQRLHFDRSQLIMNGISMGTYPALKLGSHLRPYAINIAKPLPNLGLIAERGPLERPLDFETIFDVDAQLGADGTQASLKAIDQNFWQYLNRQDLTETKIFVGYMADDDYDNQAITKMKVCRAINKALLFTYKGFPGHHNGNRAVNDWFIGRLKQLMQEFGREI